MSRCSRRCWPAAASARRPASARTTACTTAGLRAGGRQNASAVFAEQRLGTAVGARQATPPRARTAHQQPERQIAVAGDRASSRFVSSWRVPMWSMGRCRRRAVRRVTFYACRTPPAGVRRGPRPVRTEDAVACRDYPPPDGTIPLPIPLRYRPDGSRARTDANRWAHIAARTLASLILDVRGIWIQPGARPDLPRVSSRYVGPALVVPAGPARTAAMANMGRATPTSGAAARCRGRR